MNSPTQTGERKLPQLEINTSQLRVNTCYLSFCLRCSFGRYSSEFGKCPHLQHNLVSYTSHVVSSQSCPWQCAQSHLLMIQYLQKSFPWNQRLVSHFHSNSQLSGMYTVAEEQVSRCGVSSQSELHKFNLFLVSPSISECKSSQHVGVFVRPHFSRRLSSLSLSSTLSISRPAAVFHS